MEKILSRYFTDERERSQRRIDRWAARPLAYKVAYAILRTVLYLMFFALAATALFSSSLGFTLDTLQTDYGRPAAIVVAYEIGLIVSTVSWFFLWIVAPAICEGIAGFTLWAIGKINRAAVPS